MPKGAIKKTRIDARGHDHIELRPEFLAPVLKRARHERLSVVLTHTHPFPGPVFASSVDRRGESDLLPAIFGRAPEVPHGRLIIGPTGTTAALFPHVDDDEEMSVIAVGRNFERFGDRATQLPIASDTYDRQVRAFGVEGQAKIQTLTIGIVGLGGTGSVVAQQLAYLGVRNFLLIDPDCVEATNLNRVVGASPQDIGRPKVDVAKEMVEQIAPSAVVKAIQDTALRHEIVRTLLDVDLFFCCTDSHGSRAVLSQFTYQYFVPCFDMGVRINADNGRVTHISGRIQMLSPGLPCLLCSGLLDPDQVRRDLMTEDERRRDPYIVGAVVPQPAVVSINSAVASLGVTMFLSAVTGLPNNARHQIARFETGVVRSISAEQVSDVLSVRALGL
jgi:molybdopterin/thiamine biosynthesis adenylyltransferase